VERDKFTLFYVLMQVPPVIVKSLNRVAQTGYDRLRLQLSSETSEVGEGEEEAMADAYEVCCERVLLDFLPCCPAALCLCTPFVFDFSTHDLFALDWQEATQAVDWSTVDFSKSASRPMKRQHMWSVRVCVKLSAPLLIALLYFGVMYLIGSASIRKIDTTALKASVTEERKVRLEKQGYVCLSASSARVSHCGGCMCAPLL
jgi:hypothetical protein